MLFFERDIELYVTEGNGTTIPYTTTNTKKITALAGSSIQYNSTSQNTYNYKIQNTPNRINEKVLVGFSSPEFSFTTYAKPYNDTTNDTAVEKLLLKSLTGNEGTDAPTEFTTQFTSVNKLPELTFFLKFNNLIYKISNTVIKLAEYKFDLDKILTISWTAVGRFLERVYVTPSIFEDYTTIGNYLSSNYTRIDIDINDTITGVLPIISGTLKLQNQVEIVERNTLDQRITNKLDHYVKDRSTELDFTGYLKTGTNSNLDLFEKMTNDIDYVTTNKIDTIITFGKSTEHHIIVTLDNSLIELPEIKPGDVITSNIKITSRKNTVDNDDTIIKYKT